MRVDFSVRTHSVSRTGTLLVCLLSTLNPCNFHKVGISTVHPRELPHRVRRTEALIALQAFSVRLVFSSKAEFDAKL